MGQAVARNIGGLGEDLRWRSQDHSHKLGQGDGWRILSTEQYTVIIVRERADSFCINQACGGGQKKWQSFFFRQAKSWRKLSKLLPPCKSNVLRKIILQSLWYR